MNFGCFAANNATDVYLLAKTENTSELKKVENIDVVDSDGNTALCSAIKFNDVDAYNILKKAGANTEHECVKKIPTKQYQTFTQKLATTNKSWSFLGMGKWAWAAIGVGVVAGGAAATMGGGGGSGGGSNNLGNSTPADSIDCGANATQQGTECVCYAGYQDWFSGIGCSLISLDCIHGTQSGTQCVCNDGWEGSLCDTPHECGENYMPACLSGYDETGRTCQSGNNVLVECEPTQCGANAHWEGTACVCDNGYGNYTYGVGCSLIEINCGSHAYQQGNQCQCESGFTQWTEGYGCYEELNCGDYAYQNGGVCQCVSGFTQWTEGYGCYEELNCGDNGTQSGTQCVCNDGWEGSLCDTPHECGENYMPVCLSGYDETGRTCQSGNNILVECEPTQCGANAHWEGTACVCETGYENWVYGVGCSTTAINCGANAYQKGTNCECNEGYENWVSGVGCSVKVLNCGANAHQVGTFCQCDTGFISWTEGYGCYQPLECGAHAYQNGSQCECEPGYTNWTSTGCLPVSTSTVINNTSNDDVVGTGSNNTVNIYNSNENNNVYGTISGMNSGASNSSIYIKNNGNGSVFGIAQTGTNYGYSFNLRTSNYGPNGLGDVTINNAGNGNVYGIYREGILDTAGTNFFVANLMDETLNSYRNTDFKAKINVNNIGDGNVFGMYGWYLLNAYSYEDTSTLSSFNTIGEINIVNNGTGNAYGMYIPDSNVAKNNKGINASGANGSITLLNTGDGNAYGMHGKNITNLDTTISTQTNANINLVNYSDGNVFGMHGQQIHNDNSQNNTGQSIIYMQNLDSGKAVGIHTTVNGTAYNSGTIYINNIGTGTAVGIFGDENSTINNSGVINITRESYLDEGGLVYIPETQNYIEDPLDPENFILEVVPAHTEYTTDLLYEPNGTAGNVFGIYAKSGSTVNNYGNITITSNGNMYGIYTEPGATVSNYGTISLNGSSCSGTNCNTGNYIVLNGANLYNSGLMMAPQMNLNSMGGNVVAGLGSQFVVDNELSGDLNISSELVQNGNQTTYIAENMIDAGDVSGLNVRSASAMFNASLADNGHDVVMQMKDFNELTDNASLAAFLKNNYTNGNGAELFGTLKSIDNMSAFNNTLSGLTGLNTFTQFAHEDLSAMREISFSMNNKLFENSGRDSFDISDSTGYFSFSNSHNSGSGQYGISSEKIAENWKLGYGMAMANINTGDGDNMHRQNNLWLFYMPATYTNNDIELVIAPKAGFAHSEYNRRGYNNINYDGYIEKRIFGLMNDLRYPLNFGNWTFAPDLAFNAIVYDQSGHEDEQEFSLIIPDDRTVSVESGLGLYTKYEKTLQDGSRFKLNSGLMVYREFGDTYDIKLGMRGMDGTFSLYNNDYEYRGAASLGFDYTAGHLHMYGNAQYFMDNNNYMNFKGGISYRF